MAQDSVSVDRFKYIGGSDIPIIMNLSPFKTRWQLLQEKAQLVDDEFLGNKYTEHGNIMEPLIRNYISKKLKCQIAEGKHYLKFSDFPVRIHTDGENAKKQLIVEIKDTSRIYDSIEGYKHYLVQLLFYMSMRDYHHGILAVYERPEDFSVEFDPKRLTLYPVELSDYEELINEIKRSVILFISDLEKVRANPFITQEDLLPGDAEALACRLAEIKEQEEQFKEIQEEKKLVEAKLAELMEQNDIKTFDGFGWKMTRVSGKEGEKKIVQEFNSEVFKVEHPRLWKKYITEVEKVTGGRKTTIKLTRLKDES